LRNNISGKCFDNTGKAEKNSLYRIWDCNKNSKNQQFRLQYARPAELPKTKIIYKTVKEKKPKIKRVAKLKIKKNKRKNSKKKKANKAKNSLTSKKDNKQKKIRISFNNFNGINNNYSKNINNCSISISSSRSRSSGRNNSNDVFFLFCFWQIFIYLSNYMIDMFSLCSYSLFILFFFCFYFCFN